LPVEAVIVSFRTGEILGAGSQPCHIFVSDIDVVSEFPFLAATLVNQVCTARLLQNELELRRIIISSGLIAC
jgi:hypothetical protein